MDDKTKMYSIPGLRNSPPDHWQSHWEDRFGNFTRINQENWEYPDQVAWVDGINKIIGGVDAGQVIITAHSVGCAAFVHWYHKTKQPVKAALLVAPSDVERLDYPKYITGFSPLPLIKLPFKTIVVASSNDHVVSLDRAKFFANQWGSELIILNNAGHIEPKSGYGEWSEGLNILNTLL